MTETKKVRVRFAPSPTGYLHIGGARTALFNWLYARRHRGQFILRIEDTDQARSTEASTQAILDAMTWLGMNWNEGPYFQAGRVELHREMVQKLLREGKAYYCVCTPEELEGKRKRALAEGRKPKYDRTCCERRLGKTPHAVVRFRCPDEGTTVVSDLIKGTITFNNGELDDLVIERGDGYPTYNFAVVVDDALMEITHVIRGDDHLNNTPRQILLYEALGYAVPCFGHVPMILGADKTRLSKRHGATSVMAYKEMGYLPEALINYLVRLGWSHGDQEIFSAAELTEFFDLGAVGKSAAIFNPDKLLWLNQHYLRTSPPAMLVTAFAPFLENQGINKPDPIFTAQVIHDLRTRSKTLVEMATAASFYFQEEVDFEEAAVKSLSADAIAHLEALTHGLPALPEYTKEGIETLLRDLAVSLDTKLKFIAQSLRVALTGKNVSPGIDEVMITLGKERVLQRIKRAIAHYKLNQAQG